MATLGAFLLAVLLALSVSGASSRPTHSQLAGLMETLSKEAADLYSDYCEEVKSSLVDLAPSGMTRWERCEHVANEYRATCNVPVPRTLSHTDTHHHRHHVMYHPLCKYDKLRSSLLEDGCEGPVRDNCPNHTSNHTCSSRWRPEGRLCARVSYHLLTHQLVAILTPQGSTRCSGIHRELNLQPQLQYGVRGCMLAFLHGLKQQAQVFNKAMSPS